MSYAISYYQVENKIRLFIIHIIYNNINNTKKIQILHKIISNYTDFFNIDILNNFILLPNKSTGYINNKLITNIKNRFIKSIKLFIFNKNYGLYLMKYYYTIFFILYNYNSSIKYICIKIYRKSNKNKTKNQLKYNNKLLYYNNINTINSYLQNINTKYKFSYNDDNNYIIINQIINNFILNINKNNIILFSKFNITYDPNIYIALFKNISNLYKSIYYIKIKS